jgi:hypothetical protein
MRYFHFVFLLAALIGLSACGANGSFSGAAGGGSAALNLGESGVVDVCVSPNGSMRIVETTVQCKASEQRLQLSLAGSEGTDEPSGSTTAFVFGEQPGASLTANELRTLGSFQLPAGNYILTIVMSQTELAKRCLLRSETGGTVWQELTWSEGDANTEIISEALSLEGDDTIIFECEGIGNAGVISAYAIVVDQFMTP